MNYNIKRINRDKNFLVNYKDVNQIILSLIALIKWRNLSKYANVGQGFVVKRNENLRLRNSYFF